MKILKKAAAALALSALATASWAQAYPNRLLRVIVPYSAGGNTDVITRHIMRELSARLGQPIVVENKAGAGSIVGTEFVAKAPADGYTLGVVITAYATNPFLYKKLPYAPQDLTPVSMLYQSSVVLATSNPAIKNLRDLKGEGETKTISYATTGVGSLAQLLSERFIQAAGLKPAVHVPYKGAADAMNDLVSGRVTFMFDALTTMGPQLRAGKLTALAVTGSQRSAALPNVPTVVEQGFPQLDAYSWGALVAPAHTPPAVINKLASELGVVLRSPELKEKLAAINVELLATSPADAAAFIAKDAKVNGDVIRQLGLSLDGTN